MQASAVHELRDLLESEALARAREKLLPFTLYTRPHYRPSWHHRMLCTALERFARGEIPRLLVEMPPRHGKSELVSRVLPAWLFGRDPNTQLISGSYSADLSSMMSRDVQRLISSDAYKRVFPNIHLPDGSKAQASWVRTANLFDIVGARGQYRCAGVGGGLTGMGGAVDTPCFIIIDDPIKNMEEALSATYREKVWDWYTSVLLPRLVGSPSGVLLTLTRWHHDDIAGRLLQQAKSDPQADQWVRIRCPAIKEDDDPTNLYDRRKVGEALWDDPKAFPLPKLKSIKASTTPQVWASLYQQRPAPTEGGIIKKSQIRFWFPRNVAAPAPISFRMTDEDGQPMTVTCNQEPLPVRLEKDGNWGQSWDLTFKDTKGSAFVCGQVWATMGANDYLIDQVHFHRAFTATVQAIEDLTSKWPLTRAKLVEEKANGAAVLNTLKDKIAGLIAINPEGSKEARAHAASVYFHAGNVWLPHPHFCPWVMELIEELCTFPNSAYKDQMDSVSQWLIYRHGSAPVTVDPGEETALDHDPGWA
jgi:predicted phage terminase large subunit-like protein